MVAGKIHPVGNERKIERLSTDWRSIRIASALTFFRTAQLNVLFACLWPYLMEIDPQITETFYGGLLTVYNVAQALMCPGFGLLSSWMGQAKIPIIIGLFIATVGNLVYLSTPMLSMEPKWVIFTSCFITGFGGGIITVLRNVAIVASTPKSRSKALALNMWAFASGAVFGPVLQGIVTTLGYPGIHIYGNLYLNMYTAAAFASIFINVISVIIVLLYFRESAVGILQTGRPEEICDLPPFDRAAFCVCLSTMFTATLVLSNFDSLGSAYSMTMFNWTKKEALAKISGIYTAFGIVTSITYALDLFRGLNSKFDSRKSSIVGLLGLLVFHLLTFSWWGLPGRLKSNEHRVLDENNTGVEEFVGCRPTYHWCDEVTPVSQWLFVIAHVLIIGTAYPILTLNVNTLYSKIIGPRDQGILTGWLLLTVCVAKMFGSAVLPGLFQYFGPRPVWILEIATSTATVVLWILFYRRMVPLHWEPTYSSFMEK